LRRAHRGGNTLVIILAVLIALLLGAGAFFALTNDGRAWKKVVSIHERCKQSIRQGLDYDAIFHDVQTEPAKEDRQSALPSGGEQQTSPAVEHDPDYGDKLAQPFDMGTLESIPDIVDAVSPGVVGILNCQRTERKSGEPVPVGSGSGFVLSTNGYIITNQHVVEGADVLEVSLSNGETYVATLIGSDIMTDVAVLKIDAEDLTPLPIGKSGSARVGEFVLVIGDPISADELSGSVTFGIVSALARQINIDGFVNEYLQTDAAVNPGNSGGPLINMRGEVIGVTSAKYTTAGYDDYGQKISSEGIGFALPIDNVMEVADLLIKNGSTVRPGIGVTITTAKESEDSEETFVTVYAVTEGGPADQAGLKAGDVILAIDGVTTDQDGYVDIIRSKNVGDTITITVRRNNKKLDVVVTVGDMNQIHK
jgi:serine protease Do